MQHKHHCHVDSRLQMGTRTTGILRGPPDRLRVFILSTEQIIYNDLINMCTSPSLCCGVTYIQLTDWWNWLKVMSPWLTHMYYDYYQLFRFHVQCLEIPKVSLVDNEANIILWNIEQSVSFTRGGDRRLHACYTHTPPPARQKTDERTEHKI